MPFRQAIWLFCCYALPGWALGAAFTRSGNEGRRSAIPAFRAGATGVLFTAAFNLLGDRPLLLLPVWVGLAAGAEWGLGRITARPRYRHRSGPGRSPSPTGRALLWGLAGAAAAVWLSSPLLRLYRYFPRPLCQLMVWGLLAALTTGLLHAARPRWKTQALGSRGFYKPILLFFIGAFLGDVIETLFCRLAEGAWMCRGSMIWGPFSIVWGLAFALSALLLSPCSDRPVLWLFAAGAVLGGLYEYLCSLFTEVMFGTVFWDYSGIPFNLSGRINLLYCLFWGLAAVIWLRWAYPRLSEWIDGLPARPGRALAWCLAIFLTCNGLLTGLVLTRYDARASGRPADAPWEKYIDVWYNDGRIDELYPIAIRRG